MPPTSPLPFPWKLPPETLPVIDYTFDVVCTLLSFLILPPSPPHPTNHSSWAYLPDLDPANRPSPMIPPLLPLNISKTHFIFPLRSSPSHSAYQAQTTPFSLNFFLVRDPVDFPFCFPGPNILLASTCSLFFSHSPTTIFYKATNTFPKQQIVITANVKPTIIINNHLRCVIRKPIWHQHIIKNWLHLPTMPRPFPPWICLKV